MVSLYILLIAYILAVNFYAFLLVKSLRDEERNEETARQDDSLSPQPTPSPKRYIGKLLITGLLGGAITIYACIFIFKWKRTELLLMLVMPLIGVLNIYLWVLLFRSGFRFFVIG